jgi:hypothetical protein
MDLARAMNLAGEEENALGAGRLASVDVRDDSSVPMKPEGGVAKHESIHSARVSGGPFEENSHFERKQGVLAPGATTNVAAIAQDEIAAPTGRRAAHARGAPANEPVLDRLVAGARWGPLPLLAIREVDSDLAGCHRERTCGAATINPRITSLTKGTGAGNTARRSSARSAITRSTAARLVVPRVLIATLLMEGRQRLRVAIQSVKESIAIFDGPPGKSGCPGRARKSVC